MLHLGDFIYEIVWYPEDRPQGMYDRRSARYRPLSARREDRATSTFPRLSTIIAPSIAPICTTPTCKTHARAGRSCMWDNHEFTWQGWQSLQKFRRQDPARPDPQSSRQPGVVRISAGAHTQAERSFAGAVRWAHGRGRADHPFDEHGLGQEPNNLTAIGSLTGYRAYALGPPHRADRHRSAQLSLRGAAGRAEAKALTSGTSRSFSAGGSRFLTPAAPYNGGQPPESIRFGESR